MKLSFTVLILCLRLMVTLGAASLIGFLTGCSIQSSQLDTALSFFEREPKVQSGWTAQLGLVTLPVSPLEYDDELLIFANDQGDEAAFDGWTIRGVVGFGLPGGLTVRLEGSDRRYSGGGRRAVHKCTAWQKNPEDTSEWQQSCVAQFSYKNYITLNAQGLIIGINQVVGADGTRLVIRKQGKREYATF